ncbi:hypothetical protein [Streptomyces sp. NPDC001389]
MPELMAVTTQDLSGTPACERLVDLACIRNASGREFTTAVTNVVPA